MGLGRVVGGPEVRMRNLGFALQQQRVVLEVSEYSCWLRGAPGHCLLRHAVTAPLSGGAAGTVCWTKTGDVAESVSLHLVLAA